MGQGQKRIRLSQCMIVRDEEMNMERALMWAKGIAGEQIVVDTGSWDRTAELARDLGAEVFSYAWKDDFAAAKNFAIEKARGEWIAFLDADEFLDAEGAKTLSLLLDQIEGRDFDGISMAWEQVGADGRIFAHGTQIRVFKRKPDIRYKGRIHEQLISCKGRELKLADVSGQIRIFHTGYCQDGDTSLRKSERNRRILEEELAENPKDAAVRGYIGDTYLAVGNKAQAERWYRQALEYMPRKATEGNQRSAATLTRLLELEAEKKDRASMEELYRDAVRRIPEESDFAYVMGLFCAEREDFKGACAYLEDAFRKREVYGASNRAMRLEAESRAARGVYIKCLYRVGRMEDTVCQGEEFLTSEPWDMSVLSVYMQALTSQEPDAAVCMARLENLYDVKNLKDRLFLYQCAFSSKIPLLVNALWERLRPEERERLKEWKMDREGLGSEG